MPRQILQVKVSERNISKRAFKFIERAQRTAFHNAPQFDLVSLDMSGKTIGDEHTEESCEENLDLADV